jgi:hypothetical protein
MAFKLKVPETLPFLPKKRIIKQVPNSVLVGVPILAVVGGYIANKQGWIDLSMIPGFGPPGGAGGAGGQVMTQPAGNITLSAFPPIVRPNSTITITGEFQNTTGQPIAVAEGYYAVFEDIQELGKGLRNKIDSGSLGRNISVYNRVIPTTNWRDGSYSIIVADQPITGDPGDASALFNRGVTGSYNPPPPVSSVSTPPFDSSASMPYAVTVS